MLIAKDLVIKCLLGAGVCAAGGGFGIYYNKNIRNRPAKKSEPTTDKDLVGAIGLDCGTGTFNDKGTDCTIVGKKLNVKHDETKKAEGLSSGTNASPKGKIKVYKGSANSGYKNDLKFVIEEGDVNVDGSTITKLEEFETYQIELEGTSKKYYLSRKDKSIDVKRKLLGLPDTCNLPVDSTTSTSCQSISAEQLKTINFDGKKDGGATITDGTVSLTISKTSDDSFPLGFKFSFQPTKEVTIKDSNSIKENTKTDFKIKKSADNKTLTLERAWDLGKLADKVGLICNGSGNDTCTLKTEGKINVKWEESDKSEIDAPANSGSQTGKIKVYKDDKGKGFENGFKFVIEEGDIALNNSSPNKKLEEFETYEIKEDTGKYYLTRKEKAAKGIEKALGLPKDCELPDSGEKSCANLDKDGLKSINFDGKDSTKDPTITTSDKKATLKITKLETSDDDFPFNYKFELTSEESDITIPKTSSGSSSETITIKKNTNTEFKIKKDTKNKTNLTLEKAWTLDTLAKKVGLKECSNSKCSLEDNSINVHKSGSEKVDGAKIKNGGTGDKKINYSEDQEGHNQGFKFTVENDVELEKEGSDSSGTTVKILKENGTSVSYEIKKQSDNKWYLSKVTTAK